MSNTKKLLLTAGLICLVPLFIFAAYLTPALYRAILNPYLEYDVARDITISSEWVEMTPKKPLEAERQVQYLMLDITTPFKPDYDSAGLHLSDGSLVIPQVQLVDEQGTTYDLKPAAGEKGMAFYWSNPNPHEVGLPKDRKYLSVRIRCDRPFHCSRIYWHCYNQWDVS
ncbi:MAG: hypothetical protein QOE33_2083 [Acidobacteriota bacterium]|nr:hypothetical protein [Acidobacteriota bacterium]